MLIYGASGAVGSSAVQLAKHFGAKVTAVCGTGNLEWVSSLGAVRVFDYVRDGAVGDGDVYDLVLDAVGKRKTSSLKTSCCKALVAGGQFVSVDDGTPRFSAGDLTLLTELVEDGKIKPIVDRCYPLEQIVEAHRYVEQQHKKGNVIISIGWPIIPTEEPSFRREPAVVG